MAITKVEKIDEGKYQIESLPCPACKQTLKLEINGPAMFQLNQGAGAMTVLPDVTVHVRERFMSGFCGPCWIEAFGSGDDDEYEED